MKTFALVALTALLAPQQDKGRRPPQEPGPEVGQPAPEFNLRTQDGKTDVALSQLRGKPVLLIFGSWT